jgi:DNA-binding PadR family transcriptional regulator
VSNPTRLFALGLLAGEGPMHGHQLRRRAEVTDVGRWGEVRVGALYGVLHRMEAEGLIASVRREQPGNFPARTVYAITPEGHLELSTLREYALVHPRLAADPVDVALVVSSGMPAAELRSRLADRKHHLDVELQAIRAERQRDGAAGHLPPATMAVFRHWELRLEAELRWHVELEGQLDQLAERPLFGRSDDGNQPVEAPRASRGRSRTAANTSSPPRRLTRPRSRG